MLFKARLLVLGLLSMMVFGAFASTAAAEPGPWWHHREVGNQLKGMKIEKQSPETFEGKGEGTELTTKVGNEEIKLKCNIKAKGSVWNEPAQGQGEVTPIYENCESNNIVGCKATVVAEGTPQTIHLIWKYKGNAKELENKPQQQQQGQEWDGVIFPSGVAFVLNKAGTELELSKKSSFAEIKFAATGCKLLNSLSGKAEGSVAFSSLYLNEFSKEPTLNFPGGKPWQHAWWQAVGQFVPFTASLTFRETEAKFSGQLPIKFAKQEVGVFES